MCGIVGYFDKAGTGSRPLGATLLGMLKTLACRGPDSSGIALWGEPAEGLVMRVKLTEDGDAAAQSREAVRRAGRLGRVAGRRLEGALLRLVVTKAEPAELAAAVEAIARDVEVVSVGKRLEIVKQVGAPVNLDAEFHVSTWTGSHGLGHTRLSTESRVDLSHSQPFWAHGTPASSHTSRTIPGKTALANRQSALCSSHASTLGLPGCCGNAIRGTKKLISSAFGASCGNLLMPPMTSCGRSDCSSWLHGARL